MPSSSSHHGLVPKASADWDKHRHPDLDEHNNVRWEAYIDPDRREFLELWSDPVKRAAFMDGVAARQSREHEDVQAWVGGQYYAGDPIEAYRAYEADLQLARETYGRDKELTSYDVQNMDLAEYDKAFDQNGRPREGYSYRATDRDLQTHAEAGIDRFTQFENEMRARDPR